ncbi:hypothetical protein D3C80_2000120 [compost metagenome]
MVEAYGHVNLGFSEKDLSKFAMKAGFDISSCETVTRERRPPHFEVIALIARKPADATASEPKPAPRKASRKS